MFIALSSNQERVHISNIKDDEEYFCPICKTKLIVKKGTKNAHHFAHKKKCLDNWNYDMSEWHYSWQNQFPIENQEVVFKFDNQIHRADVFINNTVIEFQHSSISEKEFNDRNSFYQKLGYKVIWIFDTINKNISYDATIQRDNTPISIAPILNKIKYGRYADKGIYFSWKKPLKTLNNITSLDSKLEIYLQIEESIWINQPNYKTSITLNLEKINGNIIKMYKFYNNAKFFSSDDYYSDYELINLYTSFNTNTIKYQYKKNLNLNQNTTSRPIIYIEDKIKPDFSLIADNVYIKDFENGNSSKYYGYCPKENNEFHYHNDCEKCIFLDLSTKKCNYRFKDFPKDDISEIINIIRDRDGRIKSVDFICNKEIKNYVPNQMPSNTKTILEFANKKFKIRLARFYNVKTKTTIQMNKSNLDTLRETQNICYGKLCRSIYSKASAVEYTIYNWDKPDWLLIWIAE